MHFLPIPTFHEGAVAPRDLSLRTLSRQEMYYGIQLQAVYILVTDFQLFLIPVCKCNKYCQIGKEAFLKITKQNKQNKSE